jgi:pilus assembly protein CpaB
MSSAARARTPERQNRLIFMGAIALAALAAVLVFLGLSGIGDSGGGGGGGAFADSVDVVVASREIPAGTKVTGDMLEVATLSGNAIVEGALTETTGLEGLVVRQTLARGEQFTPAKVGQGLAAGDRTLSAVVPAGLRAIALEVNESSIVGGLVVAGDRVDVIAIFNDQNDGGLGPNAQTLLQDVEVLAVGQTAQQAVARLDRDGNPIDTDTAEGSLSTRPDDTKANEKADTVTLAVAPEDAPLLALAQDQGTVWLVLRGQGDDGVQDVGPVALP